MIRKALRLCSIIAIFASLCISCQEEAVPEERLSIPDSYLELVRAYRAGKKYAGTTTFSSVSKVFFYDGTYVIVKKEDFEINQGDVLDEHSFDEVDGCWVVDGIATGIPRTIGKLEESYPVYSYCDESALFVFASNGVSFEFPDPAYNPASDDPDEPDEPDNPDDPDEPDPVKEYRTPVIYITTNGGLSVQSKDYYIPGTVKVEDPCGYFSDVLEFEAPMKIKGRGNSTWGTVWNGSRRRLTSFKKTGGLGRLFFFSRRKARTSRSRGISRHGRGTPRPCCRP